MTEDDIYDNSSDGWPDYEILEELERRAIAGAPPYVRSNTKLGIPDSSTASRFPDFHTAEVVAQPSVNPQDRSYGIHNASDTQELNNSSDLCDSPMWVSRAASPAPSPAQQSTSIPSQPSDPVTNPPCPPAQASSNHTSSRTSVRPLKVSIDTSKPKGNSGGQPTPPECDDPPIEYRFQGGRFGANMEIEIIAHDFYAQKMMDKRKMDWGVQYEVARGISQRAWTWDQVKENLDELPTKNTEAWRVISVMSSASTPSQVDIELWHELDREQAAIEENIGRGVGLMGGWQKDQDWYGGKIQQLARLVRDRSKGSFAIQLLPMEKRRSYRFARFLGSRRILQLKVPDEVVNNDNERVRQWLRRKFIICGRVFMAFHSKDSSVYMMETDENYERETATWCGDQYRLSFSQFIHWHNPFDLNQNQPISKWSARFAIGFSDTVPGLEFRSKNIFMIDDIYSSSWDGKSKPTAEQTMTDGCGFMNKAALLKITRALVYPNLAVAVQGRIMGAKGLWILHPTDHDPLAEPRIWIRASQNKIKLPHLDYAHRIFDVITASKSGIPAALTRQSIINLSFNGIPNSEFISLQKQGLTAEVLPLMEWGEAEGQNVHLYQAVSKNGSVTATRAARLGADRSRSLGLSPREWGHENIELLEAGKTPDIEENSSGPYTGRSEPSGAPFNLNELTCELLQSGFSPLYFEPLRTKLKYIVENTVENSIEKYRIPIEGGLSAFIAPDPLGVLKEGEIFYMPSIAITDPLTMQAHDVLLGEVLIGRYPIRLPSDMQRVRAVDAPELHDWKDVIIVPIVGERSFANLLSGGDYDGDETFILWQQSLVQRFRNQPLTREPDNLMTFFERSVESGTEFNERASKLDCVEAQAAFQDVLLLGLHDAKVGLYSMFHDYSVWKFGYDHPDTILMAHIFAVLLDSSKTGHRLKPGVFKMHQAKFGGRIVEWENPHFVLTALKTAGRELQASLMMRYENQARLLSSLPDHQLRKPYETAVSIANSAAQSNFFGFKQALDTLRNHVDEVYRAWCRYCAASRKEKENQLWTKHKPKRKEDDVAKFAKQFHAIPDGVEMIANPLEVMTSYAYAEKNSPNFVLSMAFRELCHIKAKAGTIAPCTRLFDESKSASSSCLRALPKIDSYEI
ncbi:hypothetical protein AX16_006144 [Volvariella volvacea WC 439]|nr:hypothetical protein AX16_006144 [Volvariella volvacea WC 439]